MKRRVRFHARFRRDLRAQLAWLARNGETALIEALRAGLDEAARLLARHARAGAVEEAREGSELRRLILRRVPYVVWYVIASSDAGADVWVLRLFHARQRRPSPSWPAPRA
ncbi:MAG: type II toxin-antitoxin system RelE/ParE family toxin [Deltaproteobacteria bacterium]|nr:type II toxin-antitoxin system RelE/ParE family toxin [Deltaproteobacteria bacterium]